jgi:hypothetical protein
LKCEPFAGNGFEGVALSNLLGFTLGAGINAGGELLPRLLTPVARELQGHVGIDAEGDQLLAPADAVFESPAARTIGLSRRYRPRPSKILIAFGPGFAWRMRSSLSGMRHQ